jgi:hypothetical protein
MEDQAYPGTERREHTNSLQIKMKMQGTNKNTVAPGKSV